MDYNLSYNKSPIGTTIKWIAVRVVSRMQPNGFLVRHCIFQPSLEYISLGSTKNAQKSPYCWFHLFFYYVTIHLSEGWYSSEYIFFYQSQVITESVAHFGRTWLWFFHYDGNPQKIVDDFSDNSKVILAFPCRRPVLPEKIIQYVMKAVFYFPVISFFFQHFLCWHFSAGYQSHPMNVICKTVSGCYPGLPDCSPF